VASQSDWPAAKQIEQLRLHLQLLHGWAVETAGRVRRPASGSSAA
jgi:hypothetical protein